MTWNYRLVRHDVDCGEDPCPIGVHEAYYDHYGALASITEKPVPVVGDNQLEVMETLTAMMAAANRPIISWREMDEREEAGRDLFGEA